MRVKSKWWQSSNKTNEINGFISFLPSNKTLDLLSRALFSNHLVNTAPEHVDVRNTCCLQSNQCEVKVGLSPGSWWRQDVRISDKCLVRSMNYNVKPNLNRSNGNNVGFRLLGVKTTQVNFPPSPDTLVEFLSYVNLWQGCVVVWPSCSCSHTNTNLHWLHVQFIIYICVFMFLFSLMENQETWSRSSVMDPIMHWAVYIGEQEVVHFTTDGEWSDNYIHFRISHGHEVYFMMAPSSFPLSLPPCSSCLSVSIKHTGARSSGSSAESEQQHRNGEAWEARRCGRQWLLRGQQSAGWQPQGSWPFHHSEGGLWDGGPRATVQRCLLQQQALCCRDEIRQGNVSSRFLQVCV